MKFIYFTLFLGLVFNGITLKAIDNALSFDGTSNYVEINNPNLGIGGLTEITVMAWVRWDINPSTGNQWSNIFSSQSSVTKDFGQFWLQHNSTNGKFEFALQSNLGRSYIVSTTSTVQDTWFHVAGVFDGTNIKIFVNGVQEAQTGRTGTIRNFDSNFKAMIAQWAFNTEGFRRLAGTLDDVAIYKKALTSSEITDFMNNSDMIADTDTNLIAAWKFDEESGSTVEDEDNTNNDGTLINSAIRVVSTAPKDSEGSALPIELGYFMANETQEGIQLQWITVSEVNNHYFTLMVSTDGVIYVELAKIEGSNNSNTIVNYQFLDTKTKGTTLYYKLKQTDYDGKTEVFNPIMINLNTEKSISIYPNPSISTQPITIHFNTDIEGQIEIFDQTGKLYYQTSISDNRFEINIENAGMYLVKITFNGQMVTRRLIVN
jgi:hypothetical protein